METNYEWFGIANPNTYHALDASECKRKMTTYKVACNYKEHTITAHRRTKMSNGVGLYVFIVSLQLNSKDNNEINIPNSELS